MNRTIKNGILGVILILLGISIYYTATYQNNPNMKANFRNSFGVQEAQGQENQQSGKNKREKVLESAEESTSEEQNMESSMQPSIPFHENQDGETPMEGTMKEMMGKDNRPQDFNQVPNFPGSTSNVLNNPFQYITLGIEVLCFSILVIYLILSSGNLKTIHEVFASSKEVGIFSFLSILFFAVLYYLIVLVSPLSF